MIYVCPLTTPFQQYLSSNVEVGFWFSIQVDVKEKVFIAVSSCLIRFKCFMLSQKGLHQTG